MMTEFDPTKLSLDECRFVLDHVGEPPVVALNAPRAEQVTLAAVKPVIEGVYELLELEKHDGIQWAGVEAVKDATRTYIEQSEKWAKQWEKNKHLPPSARPPRFPTMYSWDARGRWHWRGIDSDSEFVKTYFDAEGKRIPFKISLIAQEPVFLPEWLRATTAPTVDTKTNWKLVENVKLNRLECPCGHTESFRGESRASYSAARARMSKHLRKATVEVENHRELHTNEYNS